MLEAMAMRALSMVHLQTGGVWGRRAMMVSEEVPVWRVKGTTGQAVRGVVLFWRGGRGRVRGGGGGGRASKVGGR